MKFKNTRFGSITIDGKKYKYDVYLYPNGDLEKRDKSHSPRINGHRSLSTWELDKITEEKPEILIIGTGQTGVLPMNEESKEWINKAEKEKGIKIIMGKTPNILDKTNEMLNSEKKVAGIFHTTC